MKRKERPGSSPRPPGPPPSATVKAVKEIRDAAARTIETGKFVAERSLALARLESVFAYVNNELGGGAGSSTVRIPVGKGDGQGNEAAASAFAGATRAKAGTPLLSIPVPRHLRRRTNSHKRYSMPQALRAKGAAAAAAAKNKSGEAREKEGGGKAKSREARRKPSLLRQNLLASSMHALLQEVRTTGKETTSEAVSTSAAKDDVFRLPATHLWHAKRFHFGNPWGLEPPLSASAAKTTKGSDAGMTFRLPLYRNDVGDKALQRFALDLNGGSPSRGTEQGNGASSSSISSSSSGAAGAAAAIPSAVSTSSPSSMAVAHDASYTCVLRLAASAPSRILSVLCRLTDSFQLDGEGDDAGEEGGNKGIAALLGLVESTEAKDGGGADKEARSDGPLSSAKAARRRRALAKAAFLTRCGSAGPTPAVTTTTIHACDSFPAEALCSASLFRLPPPPPPASLAASEGAAKTEVLMLLPPFALAEVAEALHSAASTKPDDDGEDDDSKEEEEKEQEEDGDDLTISLLPDVCMISLIGPKAEDNLQHVLNKGEPKETAASTTAIPPNADATVTACRWSSPSSSALPSALHTYLKQEAANASPVSYKAIVIYGNAVDADIGEERMGDGTRDPWSWLRSARLPASPASTPAHSAAKGSDEKDKASASSASSDDVDPFASDSGFVPLPKLKAAASEPSAKRRRLEEVVVEEEQEEEDRETGKQEKQPLAFPFLKLRHADSTKPVQLFPSQPSSASPRASTARIDLLVPLTACRALWTALVTEGHFSACGVQEWEMLCRSLQQGSSGQSLLRGPSALSFASELPDTFAGERFSLTHGYKAYQEMLRRPESQRVNFAALGSPSPFLPLWQLLKPEGEETEEGDGEGDTAPPEELLESSLPVVVRSGDYASALLKQAKTACLELWSSNAVSAAATTTSPSPSQVIRACFRLPSPSASSEPSLFQLPLPYYVSLPSATGSLTLLPVSLHLLGGGLPERGSYICLPSTEDLQELVEGLTQLLGRLEGEKNSDRKAAALRKLEPTDALSPLPRVVEPTRSGCVLWSAISSAEVKQAQNAARRGNYGPAAAAKKSEAGDGQEKEEKEAEEENQGPKDALSRFFHQALFPGLVVPPSALMSSAGAASSAADSVDSTAISRQLAGFVSGCALNHYGGSVARVSGHVRLEAAAAMMMTRGDDDKIEAENETMEEDDANEEEKGGKEGAGSVKPSSIASHSSCVELLQDLYKRKQQGQHVLSAFLRQMRCLYAPPLASSSSSAPAGLPSGFLALVRSPMSASYYWTWAVPSAATF